ncbi:MAG: ribonuclease H-like domain-containing protein, partial [Candidatus Izemoplasmatales bacterium]
AMWKNNSDDFFNIKIVSFYNEDESAILNDFVTHQKLGPILDSLAGRYDKSGDFWALCAHNGRVFDFPFIAKRLIVNGYRLPKMLDYAHLKPWEQNHIIDTKEVWSFGVWDSMVSLDTLSDLFGTKSSKDEMSGADVKDVFWKEKDLDKIAKYCEKDVCALAINYLRMKSMKEKVVVFSELPAEEKIDTEGHSEQIESENA